MFESGSVHSQFRLNVYTQPSTDNAPSEHVSSLPQLGVGLAERVGEPPPQEEVAAVPSRDTGSVEGRDLGPGSRAGSCGFLCRLDVF